MLFTINARLSFKICCVSADVHLGLRHTCTLLCIDYYPVLFSSGPNSTCKFCSWTGLGALRCGLGGHDLTSQITLRILPPRWSIIHTSASDGASWK